MNRILIVAGALAALLPGAALAQPDPNCVQSNRASRAEGTVLGAVGGALIGGALGHGTGAVVGAVGGAAAGNAIAGARNQPCPPGYYYAPPPGYGPPPPPGGYGANWRPAPPPPGADAFWRGAPASIEQRIDWMRDRIARAQGRGVISYGDAERARAELRDIRHERDRLANRDAGLNDADRYYLQQRLNHLGEMIHWMQASGY